MDSLNVKLPNMNQKDFSNGIDKHVEKLCGHPPKGYFVNKETGSVFVVLETLPNEKKRKKRS